MRRKRLYSIGEIIDTYIANVKFAHLENQGNYSFGRLMEEAEDILYEMCDYEGLNGDKVIMLADAKIVEMYCKEGVLLWQN